MHQLHHKTRKCDGKHMEIAGRGGAAEHIYIYSDGQSLRTYFGKKSEYYCFFYVLSLALRTSKTIHLERPNIKIHHLERTGDLTLRTCLGH